MPKYTDLKVYNSKNLSVNTITHIYEDETSSGFLIISGLLPGKCLSSAELKYSSTCIMSWVAAQQYISSLTKK